MVAFDSRSVKAIGPWYNPAEMRKASWILAIFFGIAFLGATLMNAALVGRARAALASAYLGPGPLAGPKAGAARFHLAVIIPDTDDSFFGGLLEGVSGAAGPAGAAVQVFRYPSAAPAEADRYFEIVLRAKVDGLIMYAARDNRAGSPTTGRAAAAARSGVVFIPVGTDAPLAEKGPFIGSGSLLQGIEGGKIIGKSLGSAARVGVVLSSSEREGGSQDPLFSGVVAALSAFRGAQVVAVAAAQPGILSGEAVVESMLRSYPGINAVLCSTARDTVGAAQVLVDRGEVGKVLIIGADETPDIQRYIDKGVIAASVVRDSRRIGAEAVKAFSLLKGGGRFPGPFETGFLVIRMKEGQR
jgi:ribose transport system substrate-binding protein